ncbi:glutathione S-transferase family protein [Halobacteriovorax sp. XZX-3]|uniref:glutathione S-transferase family protein n=1 Tax=unclassified Halobacteriovorax TaxID=2639665 RepID=UPI003714760F
MGRLVDGKWVKSSVITSDESGAYDRVPRSFRDTISSNHSKYQPESGRYHLYVSYACPWAHRTLIYRKLKSLESHISVSVVSPDMLEMGWTFDKSIAGATGDDLYGLNYLQEIYLKADPKVSTTVTVPILWDKKTQTIVNNESSEIIRIFNSEFNELTGNHEDFYPEDLADKIDELNEFIYSNINNGVYRSGFAKTQEAYESAVTKLFTSLDRVEEILEGQKYLLGDRLTEADLRLVPTLLRFDCVYVTHFKCNLKRIKDYKNLSRYVRDLYSIEGIKETTNIEHIKRHYFYSHDDLNPYRIVALGPSEIF